MRALSLLIPLVVACTSTGARVSTSAPIDPSLAHLDHMRNTAVRIWVDCDDSSISGTGVVVSQAGHILTASHLVDDCRDHDPSIALALVMSDYDPPSERHKAVELAFAKHGDLSLLATVEPLNAAHIATLERDYWPRVGVPIRIVGFSNLPFEANDEDADPKRAETGFQLYGSIVQSGRRVGDRLKWIHYEGRTLAGTSGGGVWTMDGHLVAIHKGRWVGTVKELFNNEDHKKWGNTIEFEGVDGDTERFTLDYKAMRGLLEYISRGTSIQYIPDEWVEMIRTGNTPDPSQPASN